MCVFVFFFQIHDGRLNLCFSSLQGLVDIDTVFAAYIIPHLMLQSVIENNIAYINEVSRNFSKVSKRLVYSSLIFH